jgi:cobalt-zinc-cadmium efflux system outer membrane protein
VIRSVGITRLAAIEATTALLWLSPAEASDQTIPGATVESVVEIAKRLNPTVAAASLDFSAALNMVEMERLAGGSL